MKDRGGTGSVTVWLLFLTVCTVTAPANGTEARCVFDFQPTALELAGPPGAVLSSEIVCTVECDCTTTGPGITSWQLSIRTEGDVRFTDATFEDTDGDRYYDEGFRHIEITVGDGNEGLVSGVVLSFHSQVMLPKEGVQTIARATVTATCPAQGDLTTGLIRPRDGLIGGGLPIENIVVLGADRYVPQMESLAVIILGVAAPEFIRGDVDASGSVGVGDPVSTLMYLFRNGPMQCGSAADTDDNGVIEVADAIRLLSYLFIDGPPPAAPFPYCGVDPTPQEHVLRECGYYAACTR